MKISSAPRVFTTTQWSMVNAAKSDAASQTIARKALEELCRIYWYPLYAFVRSRGYSAEDSKDLTQAFFTNLLEKGGFTKVDRKQGRFRSYLLGALKHFLANEWNREKTQKRGGKVRFIEWDDLNPESRFTESIGSTDNPEQLFDREWALETISGALKNLRLEMAKVGKADQFEVLKSSLTWEDETQRKEIADRLGMTEGAVKVAIHRLRQRYRKLLRAAVAETVGSEADLNVEMHYLVEVLRRD